MIPVCVRNGEARLGMAKVGPRIPGKASQVRILPGIIGAIQRPTTRMCHFIRPLVSFFVNRCSCSCRAQKSRAGFLLLGRLAQLDRALALKAGRWWFESTAFPYRGPAWNEGSRTSSRFGQGHLGLPKQPRRRCNRTGAQELGPGQLLAWWG